jgi:hypothetical protein
MCSAAGAFDAVRRSNGKQLRPHACEFAEVISTGSNRAQRKIRNASDKLGTGAFFRRSVLLNKIGV